jgi:hypothetical protein
MVLKLHLIERCTGGDKLMASHTFFGLLERDMGMTQTGINQQNTATSIAYMRGDEPFLSSINFNATGYYIEYITTNGHSEFYKVERFTEGMDFECCVLDHYELELSRVKRPIACQ